MEIEKIKFTQTQTLSSASSAVGESSDGLALASAAIDERVIADEVLGVRRGYRKSVGRIGKGKRKVLETSYSTLAYGSLQSQAAEEQSQLAERVDAQ